MRIAKNGRSIAFAEAGRRDGAAVLVWHGFPGTSLQAGSFFTQAEALGLRVVALDRPGYGGSSAAPGADWRVAIEDAAEVLRHLGAPSCHLIGISGGAPYARAFAKRHPELSLSVTTVGGLASLYSHALPELPWAARAGLVSVRALPLPLLRAFIRFTPLSDKNFDQFLEKFEKKLCPADQEVLKDAVVRRQLLKSFDQGLAPGYEGLVLDLKAFWQLSALEFFELHCPWHLWHGAEDRVVTPLMGRGYVPDSVWSRAQLLKDHGHYSVPVRCAKEILVQLQASR